MKKPLLLIAFAALSVFSSSLSAQCVKIVRDTATYDDGMDEYVSVHDYLYDNNGRIAKVTTRDAAMDFVFRYDTAYYMSGKMDSIVTYQFGMTGFEKSNIIKNTWSGNLLIKQTSDGLNGGTDHDTTVYTYSGSTLNTLTSLVETQWEGATKEILSLTNITFTGNNMTGALFSGEGASNIPVTVTYDAYANPFYGWPGNDDFLAFFSANNATSAYPVGSPSTPLFSRAYGYSNGVMVSSSEDYESGESERKSYVYDCMLTSIAKAAAPQILSSYPNPSADGKFHVNADNLTIQEVVVISSTGEVVSNVPVSVTASGIDIDLSNEAKGIYLVQFRGAKTVASAKLIKQ